MYKNAGSTLDWSLRRSFGASYVARVENKAMRDNPKSLYSYVDEHPRVRVLSSQWLPLPVPAVFWLRPYVLLFLRHPVDRCRSVYNFARKQQHSDQNGAKQAREFSFVDFVKWRMETTSGPVIRDFQTRYCSGKYSSQDMDEVYELAVANLDATPFVGFVHRYPESIALFEAPATGLPAYRPFLESQECQSIRRDHG